MRRALMAAAAACLAALGTRAEDPELVWVDVHSHLIGKSLRDEDWPGAVRVLLAEMDAAGVKRTLVLPPPQVRGRTHSQWSDLAKAVAPHQDRLGFLGGGGSLNVMLHDHAGKSAGGAVPTRATEARFRDTAKAMLAAGARGFGELAVQHLSYASHHPYENVAADHPLFLLLADLAAEAGVPVDVHMDAAAAPKALRAFFRSPPNQDPMPANLAGFERLLAHNRKARIVWAHAGRDVTGDAPPALLRRLLAAHPNLYLSLSPPPPAPLARRERSPVVWEHAPLADDGSLRPEWLALLRDFPDRFVLGADNFYASPKIPSPVPHPTRPTLAVCRRLLVRLPGDLARKVASENAARIYGLRD